MQCPSCGNYFDDKQVFCTSCRSILKHDGKPALLDHYRLVEKIGEGGMGVVYHAIDENDHADVAIKVLHQHLLGDPVQVERFRREAHMHGQLHHPNIINLIEVYEGNGIMGMVMELVKGCSLKRYLNFRKIPSWPEVVTLSQGILTGLAAAHDQHVVHRDLKLSNVYLGDNGSIKLLDFGLAKSKDARKDITQSGVTVGSYYYMSPEQITGKEVTARADLYAFGIMLYRICAGVLPFISYSGGEFEIMEKQVRQAPEPPKNHNGDIPAQLSDLIMALLEKNPDDRPQSCAEVLKAIESIAKPAPLQKIRSKSNLKKQLDFSELNEDKSKRPKKEDGSGENFTDTTSGTDLSAHDKKGTPPPNSMLWAFRKTSPAAPDILPLDLRSPPPISAQVLTRLKKAIRDIPPLPEVWYKVQNLMNDPQATPMDLGQAIEQDPVLTEHILALTNSPAYNMGDSSRVTNVAVAITRLGMNAAHDLILQNVVPKLGNHGNKSDNEIQQIWFHSQAIALFARILSDYASVVDRHSASLFGMLHDIGKLVILHIESGANLEALRRSIESGTPALRAEWDTLGYTHIDAGMMLALHWKLPRSVHRFIYFHHHPDWHHPEQWPTDIQASSMLIHMSHIILQDLLDHERIGDSVWNIWSKDVRSHVDESERILHHPLKLPLTDIAAYSQIKQELARLEMTFPDIFPQ